VIYAMKTPENDSGMNLPLFIGKALDKRGLLHNWISEDYRAKRSYDVTTESVTISTIHSVKGFDRRLLKVPKRGRNPQRPQVF